MVDPLPKTQNDHGWVLEEKAFQAFLSWLDDGEPSDGGSYLEMRRRLVAYFDRKNCLSPDDLADETLNRVTRRLDEEGSIETETPAKYCYIVARFVFLEYLRGGRHRDIALDDVTDRRPSAIVDNPGPDDLETKEKMLDCLEQCQNKLDVPSRELIVRYYYGAERVKIDNRRALAIELDITPNALAIRACRIREKLERCVNKCVG